MSKNMKMVEDRIEITEEEKKLLRDLYDLVGVISMNPGEYTKAGRMYWDLLGNAAGNLRYTALKKVFEYFDMTM